jgi:hypothetical protein
MYPVSYTFPCLALPCLALPCRVDVVVFGVAAIILAITLIAVDDVCCFCQHSHPLYLDSVTCGVKHCNTISLSTAMSV